MASIDNQVAVPFVVGAVVARVQCIIVHVFEVVMINVEVFIIQGGFGRGVTGFARTDAVPPVMDVIVMEIVIARVGAGADSREIRIIFPAVRTKGVLHHLPIIVCQIKCAAVRVGVG